MVSTGRNNNKNSIERYLGSLAGQNYSNYHIVHVDDASDDGAVEKMQELVFLEYPELKEKLTIVSNTERTYPLRSKHKAITEHCRDDEIVIDFNINSELIGRQVLKLFNVMYI